MEQPEGSGTRQFSITLNQDDYEVLARLAKLRRASVAQVIRTYIGECIERDRHIVEPQRLPA
jgi:hypothetical protein